MSGGVVYLSLGKLWGWRIDHLAEQPAPVLLYPPRGKGVPNTIWSSISIINSELQHSFLYLYISSLLNFFIYYDSYWATGWLKMADTMTVCMCWSPCLNKQTHYFQTWLITTSIDLLMGFQDMVECMLQQQGLASTNTELHSNRMSQR